MKKISLGVLCALGILITGCDTDIPTDEVGVFSIEDSCGLTGGSFNKVTKICTCGTTPCEKDVTCKYNQSNKTYECLGQANTDLPELTCTLQGQRICVDRVDGNGSSGYYVECDGANWGEITQCPSGNSCKSYLEHTLIYSSECGDCQNNGTTCINGVLIAQ